MLFGRDAEQAAIEALLDAARASRSGTLVLRGEAGVGKTALLDDARDRAADMHVLSARGVESEAELPFGALDQLLRPALGHLDALPEPQSAALKGALGLAPGTSDERFLVYAACLSLLSELAERRPVLCLVDDAHWLDTASAHALLFVARRLGSEGIAMLFAARSEDERDFDATDVPSLEVEGLARAAAEELLTQFGSGVSPGVRARLVEQTRGNALALVELPSALTPGQLAGSEPLPEALPLTSQVESVFLARVRRLPEDTQRLLLVAAADDAEDVALVAHAARLLGSGADALAPAEVAGLVSARGNRLEFRHPLVRSAVYQAATPSERRAAHGALADALADDAAQADRRAWHLAGSTLEPDEEVVRALEDAAARATGRSGHMAAAKALARAAELSADQAGRGRRLVLAARAASLAGADDYAIALASHADPLVEDQLLRAEIARAIGAAGVRGGRPLEGVPALIEAAYAVAPLDLGKAAELLVWANAAGYSAGGERELGEVSRAAEAIIASSDGELRFVGQGLAAFARAMEGRTPAAERLAEAYEWALRSESAELVFVVSVAAHFAGDDPAFVKLINHAISLSRARGELGILAEALTTRAIRHVVAQRFDEAARAADESVELARELGYANVVTRALSVRAIVDAVHGDEEHTRRNVEEVLSVATANGLPPRVASAHYSLALLDLGSGRWTDALERLELVVDGRPESYEPMLAKYALPDVVEAAARAERPERAQSATEAFAEWTATGPAWAAPRLSSCRALLAKGDEASTLYEQALAAGAAARPFDLARIQLLYGEHLRRERRRTDSRAQLRAALDAFERFRAVLWAERARTELRASGETARKRDPSTVDQLTPQELQIARFVAEGLSNKEVAAQLFLSPRTIDYHLRNVFSKLGITSRMQLARHVPVEDESAVAS